MIISLISIIQPALAEGRSSAALAGSHSAREAVARLLDGSGLEIVGASRWQLPVAQNSGGSGDAGTGAGAATCIAPPMASSTIIRPGRAARRSNPQWSGASFDHTERRSPSPAGKWCCAPHRHAGF
jgi:hypothetical protein